MEFAEEIFDRMNKDLPCPPFEGSGWSSDCISWFKDTPSAQEWISVFRDIIAILEDCDLDVGTLTTDSLGMIVYEDDYQIVAQSRTY